MQCLVEHTRTVMAAETGSISKISTRGVGETLMVFAVPITYSLVHVLHQQYQTGPPAAYIKGPWAFGHSHEQREPISKGHMVNCMLPNFT